MVRDDSAVLRMACLPIYREPRRAMPRRVCDKRRHQGFILRPDFIGTTKNGRRMETSPVRRNTMEGGENGSLAEFSSDISELLHTNIKAIYI